MTVATACRACGIELRTGARFCDSCGSPVAPVYDVAEYKQVTVLFADVVHSMDIAPALGAERLSEVMTELFDRSAVAVRRYGGTVDKFTGDGIMALFGAPIALEDHAFRACLAALDIQQEAQRLAAEIQRRDDVALRLRVGLNSGQVVAGVIGTSSQYTAVGEQVGMAQRMESVAPPGGVMLSESTARLVANTALLGEPELVHIKGAEEPVPARRLLATGESGRLARRGPTLVGRERELSLVAGLLEQASDGGGCVVGVVGPAGIGKSRLVVEAAVIAQERGIEIFSASCEPHASGIPFHAVARMLREALGVNDLDDDTARSRVQGGIPGAEGEDLILLEDLIGIRDPAVAIPDIAPDARRRRLAQLVNAALLARQTPALYVIEDAHWIDDVSESMLAAFISWIPQTHSVVLITYRPQYRGALARTPDIHTIALAPLGDAQTRELLAELLGSEPSVAPLAERIAERAAGNPFFAEEMVRELADRGVLAGERGAYVCHGDLADVSVPATVQAAIEARIDRLDVAAKHALTAAAVIGSRFDTDLLASVLGDGDGSDVTALVAAELIDRVGLTPRAEYAFRHPLICAVAYESQLKSTRAQSHRRLATAIEQRDPDSLDENAALIATHWEAAGDLHPAFGWHMRAGAWSNHRDLTAARMSWQQARHVADRLPANDPDRAAIRIAPRTLLCATAWQVGSSVANTGFDELRELTTAAGDQLSLAIGMAGLLMSLTFHARIQEASQLAAEHANLLESIGIPEMTVALLAGAVFAKFESGEMAEARRLAQRVIDLAGGDPTMGNLILGSPLAQAIAWRGAATCFLGLPGWREDFDNAIAMARTFDPTTYVAAMWYKYGHIAIGTFLPDPAALRDTAEALRIAERSADDFTLTLARLMRGVVLVYQGGPDREHGFELLAQAREMAVQVKIPRSTLLIIDTETAKEKARAGDLDGAIDMSRTVISGQFGTGGMVRRGSATTVLVDCLLRRGADGDLQEAQAAVDRLAAAPTDPGFVLHELPLLRLRALLAQAHGDQTAYRQYTARYQEMATSCGFEGHLATAQAMAVGKNIVQQPLE